MRTSAATIAAIASTTAARRPDLPPVDRRAPDDDRGVLAVDDRAIRGVPEAIDEQPRRQRDRSVVSRSTRHATRTLRKRCPGIDSSTAVRARSAIAAWMIARAAERWASKLSTWIWCRDRRRLREVENGTSCAVSPGERPRDAGTTIRSTSATSPACGAHAERRAPWSESAAQVTCARASTTHAAHHTGVSDSSTASSWSVAGANQLRVRSHCAPPRSLHRARRGTARTRAQPRPDRAAARSPSPSDRTRTLGPDAPDRTRPPRHTRCNAAPARAPPTAGIASRGRSARTAHRRSPSSSGVAHRAQSISHGVSSTTTSREPDHSQRRPAPR